MSSVQLARARTAHPVEIHRACGTVRTALPRIRCRNHRRVSVVVHAAQPSKSAPKKVVVVGAGWAGFGATKHLAEQGYDVELLDAAENPGGLSAGWRTKDGKPVEAGMKGFWYHYPNIYDLVKELEIENPFTPFTTSGFWTPEGLSTSAPVFSQEDQLPALIGQFVYTNPLFRTLTLADRFTMIPWLFASLDFESTAETYEAYDSMSALDMFRKYGVSKRMYEGFIKPTLLVALFAPPETLSAGATMGCLYFYALQHQNSFDVCWCRGSVAERIFAPLIDKIRARSGRVTGSRLVERLEVNAEGLVDKVVARNTATGETVEHAVDAVVFAVGVTGMQKIVSANPALGDRADFRRVMNLQGLDVVSTRLWLDRRVPTQFPANVLAGFDDDMGSTYFNLNDLHDEYRDSEQTVIASDFYHSNSIMPLPDEAIVAKVKANLDACEPAFRAATVEDYAVLRFPKAVTHFTPGSYRNRPQQATSIPNVFMAGDWVKGVPHGANGLSQERAYVTGLIAANLVCQRLDYGVPAPVLPVEEDEPHIRAGRDAVRSVRTAAEAFGLQRNVL
eukprot:jgi/Ulvmu1/1903/UM012_0062.1